MKNVNKQEISVSELENKALEIRKSLLELAVIQNIHIGGDLSITDVMTVLWQYKMKYDPQNPDWEERDPLASTIPIFPAGAR